MDNLHIILISAFSLQTIFLLLIIKDRKQLLQKLFEAADIIVTTQQVLKQYKAMSDILQNVGDSIDNHLGGDNTISDIQAYINKAVLERIDSEKNSKE